MYIGPWPEQHLAKALAQASCLHACHFIEYSTRTTRGPRQALQRMNVRSMQVSTPIPILKDREKPACGLALEVSAQHASTSRRASRRSSGHDSASTSAAASEALASAREKTRSDNCSAQHWTHTHTHTHTHKAAAHCAALCCGSKPHLGKFP
eukprot:144177-Amphidinium_carterae.2